METLPTPLGAPGASTGAGTAGAGAPGASASANGAGANVPGKPVAPKSTAEQRAKWRAKHERAKLKKDGGATATAPAPGKELPSSTNVASEQAAIPGAPAPVPWTAEILRPMFEQCVPAAEGLAKLQLCGVAKEISPAALKLVQEQGGWNPVSVAAVKESGAQTAAKYLNASGVSAEYAPEVQLSIALGAILFGHIRLLSALHDLAAEKKANKSAIDVDAKVVVQPDETKTDKSSPAAGALA